MCDGMAQGHDGINYSLAHREAITNLVEAQANATTFDGGVFISSCDKAMPAMLMSIGRMKDMMAAIVVTGGVMEHTTCPPSTPRTTRLCHQRAAHPGADRQVQRTVRARRDPGRAADLLQAARLPQLRRLLLYGHCLHHAGHGRGSGPDAARHRFDAGHCPRAEAAAYDAGAQLMKLVEAGVTAGDIVDMRSFENAIMVHAAISGSTNA